MYGVKKVNDLEFQDSGGETGVVVQFICDGDIEKGAHLDGSLDSALAVYSRKIELYDEMQRPIQVDV